MAHVKSASAEHCVMRGPFFAAKLPEPKGNVEAQRWIVSGNVGRAIAEVLRSRLAIRRTDRRSRAEVEPASMDSALLVA